MSIQFNTTKQELESFGYAVLDGIYSEKEVLEIISLIDALPNEGDSFMKTKDLFAIRKLLKQLPNLKEVLFNETLKQLLTEFYPNKCFLTKAIYFDKPVESNWFVSYHQDLSISVDKKVELVGYKNWTSKRGQVGVQPPLKILQDTVTVRIHLDDTFADNGALRVIPKSHKKGVVKPKSEGWKLEEEKVCEVRKGGVMFMNPLTFHASSRTINHKRRRVIHLEFNEQELDSPLGWLEKEKVFT